MKRALLALTVLVNLSCGNATSPDSVGAAETMGDEPAADPAADPGGVGSIQTRDPRGETGKLRLEKVTVKAEQAGDLAEVVVEHVFASDADIPLEGTFRFPMPDGAIVTGLSMMVDGKMIEGELVENEKARKIYEEIVDSMQDPAILTWEHGSTFKMRVFPIEPRKTKVVAMRYLVPLRKKGQSHVFVQGTRSIDEGEAIADLTVEWGGKPSFAERNVARGRIVEIRAADPPAALREERAEAIYTTRRIQPDWALLPASAAAPPRSWIIVVDTSRSSLEERALELTTLRAVLKGLDPRSRFVTATSDLETHLQATGFVSPTAQAIDDAARFVEATSPDGATDLGEMLHVVGEAAIRQGDTGVVYLGDCEATWGVTSIKDLRDRAAHELAGVPLYPLVLGGSVDAELARELASATSGRMFRAHRPEDVDAFVAALRTTPKRLSSVELVQVPGSVILPVGKRTLDEGEELVALVRTPRGEAVPASITMRADVGGKSVDTAFDLSPTPTAFVARRFGAAWVHELERLGKPKDEIVKASIDFSVMSKHTSFLVLDSEEAYQRYAIHRREKQGNDPKVLGVDALDEAGADISLDRIQPGDPEIVIDAPRDAERVFVVLPSGDTKEASYDVDARNGRGAWMVRFLVDKGTPEGSYEARVFIQLAAGRRETRSVRYVVDTTAPMLDVQVRKARGKRRAFEITVTQRAPKAEVDTRRVEVQTPDGQTLSLVAIRWGEFRGLWRPTGPVAGTKLHVVGFDQALNHAVLDVEVP